MPLQGKVGFSRKSKQNLLPHRVMQNFTSDYFEGACTVSIIFKTYFNFENIYISPSDRCLILTVYQQEFYFHIIFALLEVILKNFKPGK